MDWAIGITRNPFTSARIKLTFLYTLITMMIIAFFSIALFQLTTRNIRVAHPPRPENEFIIREIMPGSEEILVRPPTTRGEFEREVRSQITQDIKENILIIDGMLFILVLAGGYILSGRVLRPIEHSYLLQKKFIADASHDLRTPLAVMRSEIEVALLDRHQASHDLLQSNLEEVHHMSQLVDNLFLLTQLDEEKSLTHEMIDMSEFLEKVVGGLKFLAEEKGLIMTTSIAPGLVLGEKVSLERALRNVINNAVSYTDQGSVSIVGERGEKVYRIIITDTGKGIAEDVLPHVCERFYRGDQSRNDRNHTGLGLAIASEIIHLHHGTLEIVSHVGTGTVVAITLPSQRVV